MLSLRVVRLDCALVNDESELLLFLLVPSVSAVADRLRKGLSVAVFGCTGSAPSTFHPLTQLHLTALFVCLTATSASFTLCQP